MKKVWFSPKETDQERWRCVCQILFNRAVNLGKSVKSWEKRRKGGGRADTSRHSLLISDVIESQWECAGVLVSILAPPPAFVHGSPHGPAASHFHHVLLCSRQRQKHRDNAPGYSLSFSQSKERGRVKLNETYIMTDQSGCWRIIMTQLNDFHLLYWGCDLFVAQLKTSYLFRKEGKATWL